MSLVAQPTTWRRHLELTLIIACYLVLGAMYSVATPIFEASDEIWHYPYVKLIAGGEGLPVQKPRSEDNVARQEGSQPPLYYALSALATFWIDTGDFASLVDSNPHARVGVPGAHGNKNMVIHTSHEDFPYRGPALAVHIIRWLSILMGAMTIACVYATVRRVLPLRREVALGAAALVAFNPMFLFISASVNNDTLMTMLASVIVLMLVVFVAGGITFRRSLVLGLALGLALLSKLTGLGLIPLVLASLALISFRRRSLTHFVSHAATTFLTTALVAGWWYVRNWLLYDDPTGLSTMLKIVGTRSLSLFDLLPEFEGFRVSFWGLFGAVNVLADEWVYKLLDYVTILASLGLMIAAGRAFAGWMATPEREPEPMHVRVWEKTRKWLVSASRNPTPISDSILVLIPALWLLIVLVLFVKWTQTTLASQGRLIFPAFLGIALLLSLGLAALAPRRLSWLPLATFGAFLLGFSAISPFRYIAPSYAAPPILAEKDLPPQMRSVNVDFDGKMRLLGYNIDRDQLRPGDNVNVTLYWRALFRMEQDHSIFIQFLDANDHIIVQEDTYPGLGSLPTSRWKVGDVVAEQHRLLVPPTAKAPATVRLIAGMYTVPSMERLPAYDDNMNRLPWDASLLGVFTLGFSASMPPGHITPLYAAPLTTTEKTPA